MTLLKTKYRVEQIGPRNFIIQQRKTPMRRSIPAKPRTFLPVAEAYTRAADAARRHTTGGVLLPANPHKDAKQIEGNAP